MEFNNDESRILLIYLAIKYQGDYDKIITALELKEDVPYNEALDAMKKIRSKVITFYDYDYPEKLKRCYRPPLVLFYYGDITLIDDTRRSFGVVGSREYDEYGKKCVNEIVSPIIRGKVLVSGLARGIDTFAHECAINNNARTIAVMCTGIDMCYPPENQELYEKIKKEHLLISEYPGQVIPERDHFSRRNRILVALSDGLFVPQINTFASGTMVSLTIATNLNKEVFVAPYPYQSQTINNKLIREGATLAESGEDIAEDLGW